MTIDNKPIRWLHLSDFHVGKDDYGSQKMFDYILAHVRKQKSAGFIPDLLFLTGDLADKGLEEQYLAFWLEFVEPLQAEIGSEIVNLTFAVPGNHDVDRNENQAFSREEMSSASSRHFDPTVEAERLRGILKPRFKAYSDSDCTIVKGAFSGPDGAFATNIEIQGIHVGVVGINTAWLSKDEADERRLTPGKPLLEKALSAIKDAELRIVLGHHPVGWLIPEQQRSIKSLLGQHHALYLHGHLHEAWAEPTYGSGNSFLAIQAGASFQAREWEKWRNGLVWGEAHLNLDEVRLQAWHWSSDQQTWTQATEAFAESHRKGEWWHYQLPGNSAALNASLPLHPTIQPPRGWSFIEAESLAQHCVPLPPEAALRFFDGAVPDWSTALSTSIPRRKIVQRLVAHFQNAETAGAAIVTLLLAPACEGKTTALLQAAYGVVGSQKSPKNWRILQRRDEGLDLVAHDILPLLDNDFNWLVVVDEADRVAPKLRDFIRGLPGEFHGRVHCLLACRDSDWQASGADKLNWIDAGSFHQERLEGLVLEDAQAIVEAWQVFGDEGLGDLVLIRK